MARNIPVAFWDLEIIGFGDMIGQTNLEIGSRPVTLGSGRHFNGVPTLNSSPITVLDTENGNIAMSTSFNIYKTSNAHMQFAFPGTRVQIHKSAPLPTAAKISFLGK